jgi:excisionase family DNA binding protein
MAGVTQTAPIPDLLTIEQVADALMISTRTVRRLVERGDLEAFRVGERQLRVSADECSAYLERQREGRGP